MSCGDECKVDIYVKKMYLYIFLIFYFCIILTSMIVDGEIHISYVEKSYPQYDDNIIMEANYPCMVKDRTNDTDKTSSAATPINDNEVCA